VPDQPNRNRAAAALPIAILFLLCVGFYWKLVLTDQYVWFDHPDMCYIEIPRLEFQAREIHASHFPLWDSALWMGQPLIGQTQPGPLYPLNLLFYLLPLRAGYIRFDFLNWYWMLIHFLAALCCYLLCRDLGRSRAASILAGCVFAFGGFIGTVAWLDVVNGAVWTPLILMYFFRAWRGQRPWASAALAGFWLGIAWLCGHHEIPLMVSYTLLFAWIFAILQHGRPDWARLRMAAVTFLVAGLIAAVQLWPTYEFGRLSKRWVGTFDPVGWTDPIPYTIATVYSMPVRALLGALLPGQINQADTTPYLGIVAVSLALLGLVTGWNDRRVRWLGALAALAAVYALGALTPLQGVLYAIAPMLGKARIPVRAIHLLNFAIAALAAYGVDAALTSSGGLWTGRLRLGLAAFGGLILGVATVTALTSKPDLNKAVLLTGVVAIAVAGTLLARHSNAIGRRSAVVILVALVILELYSPGTATFANRFDKGHYKFVNTLLENKDIVIFLRNQQYAAQNAGSSPIRVEVNDHDIPTNFGDWHGIDMRGGYTAGVTANLLRLEWQTKRTQSLLGITHSVGRQPARPDMEEIFAGESGIKVWRNPDTMPRVWAVHEARAVKHDYDIRRMIQDEAVDLHRTTAILGEAPPLETCEPDGAVRLLRRRTDRLTVSAKLSCAGMVILAEPFYPGWTATVDDKPARIWEAYGSLRGVVVQKGEHEVKFAYRPLSVYGGAALTALGILLTLIFVRR
jgi:Predicted membrane protein